MNVREAFKHQGVACEALGSPFMGRLMPMLGARLERGTPIADRVLNWSGDPSPSGDNVPLRLAGALHALKLDGLALGSVYPPNRVDDDTLWSAIQAAMHNHSERLLSWIGNAPQTNEVRRAAFLLPALVQLGKKYSLPVELLELGASAGLNMRCDQFWLKTPDGGIGNSNSQVILDPVWRNAPDRGPLPEIVARKAVDLNPLNPADPLDQLRLKAYLWPDQLDRLKRTEEAIKIAQNVPIDMARGDAAAWTENALSEPAHDRLRVLYHTVAWQYFPEETKDRIETALTASESPVVRLSMESDGGDGAALSMITYQEGKTRHLGRASFHGIWVDWAQ